MAPKNPNVETSLVKPNDAKPPDIASASVRDTLTALRVNPVHFPGQI